MKPTTAELDRRIEEVKQALITAMPRYAIVRNMAERYGVAERTADNYIAKAKTALKTEHEADRPYLMAEHVAHRRNLRAQFRRQNDYYGELKAAQDEAKLLGLYPATRHELGGPDGGPVEHIIRFEWADDANDHSDATPA